MLLPSGEEWQFYISTFKEFILADQLADLPPKYWHVVVKNGNFTFLLLDFIFADQLADLPSPKYWHLVVKNGNLRFLLLEFILAD